jgi:DNA modification methylase
MKIYEDKWGVLYLGDALEILPAIQETVDMVLTDPPFMISREMKITRSKDPLKHYKFKGKDINLYMGDWDVFKDEKEYWKFTYKWVELCWNLLRKGGHFLTFFDKFKITPLVKWIENHDGIARQPLFWIKENPVPVARKISFMNAVTLIFWATKHSTSRKFATFNYQEGQHPDYIFAPICSGKERYQYGFHPCQKPEKVIAWILRYLSNESDLVLDPFAGSGTTCVVAKKMKRRYVGIEKDENYFEIAVKRLKNINDLFL